ncbi:MAG: hypothetical protein KAH13_00860 [Tenericutes bacterium]|nr:hypothetical protein [Mycoplasmatota bacterium]
MMKYNRYIDEQKLNNSKQQSINFVMEKVLYIKEKRNIFSNFKVVGASLTLALVVVLSYFMFLSNPTLPIPELSEFSQEKIVETSYLTGNVLAHSVNQATTLSAMSLSFMYVIDSETEFEQDIDNFNLYFDMLTVFIDDTDFNKNVSIEYLDGIEYDVLISYVIDSNIYAFYLKIDNTILSGVISINQKEYIVKGELVDLENNFSLKLKAESIDDYIEIEYQTETKEETQKQFHIEQNINGVYLEREIQIKYADNLVKIEISDGNGEYKLEQFSTGDVTVYYLEYNINDSEGEVFITESVDEFNNTQYHYDITEEGIEKEFDLEDPNDHDEEDDEEDEEDEDEEGAVETEAEEDEEDAVETEDEDAPEDEESSEDEEESEEEQEPEEEEEPEDEEPIESEE